MTTDFIKQDQKEQEKWIIKNYHYRDYFNTKYQTAKDIFEKELLDWEESYNFLYSIKHKFKLVDCSILRKKCLDNGKELKINIEYCKQKLKELGVEE